MAATIASAPRPASRRDTKVQAAKEILGAEDSAALRDRLVAEFGDLTSGDDAALWAHRSLVEKNKLTAADAHQVEEAFQARLATLGVANGSPDWRGAIRKVADDQEVKDDQATGAVKGHRQERAYTAGATADS